MLQRLKWFQAVLFMFVLSLVLVPAMVIAQEATGSPPSIWDQILSPATLSLVVSGLLGLLGMLVNGEVRRRRVAKAAYHAFQIVNDIDAELGPEDTTLDKVQAGLKAADDWMKASGWRPLRPDEKVLAQLQFQALHGEEKVAAKLAASPQ